MRVFNKNYTLALIKEVGEEDVLLSVNDKDIIVKLTEENKIPLFNAVEENIYLVPFDTEKNELLLTIDDATFYEMFPESDLEELYGAADEETEEQD